jgi:hypothetical protein
MGLEDRPDADYKFADQWVLNDRVLADVTYSHVGNNFILDYHDPSLSTVQPFLIVSTGINGRSTPDNAQSVNIRPVNSREREHELLHARARWAVITRSSSAATGRTRTATTPPYAGIRRGPVPDRFQQRLSLAATACQAQVTRDGQTAYDLLNLSRVRSGHVLRTPADGADRCALRLQPRSGACVERGTRTRSCRSCCRGSRSRAPTLA